ncbi:hypothetical protein ACFLZ1_01715 [Patescibacteria group bacterium]
MIEENKQRLNNILLTFFILLIVTNLLILNVYLFIKSQEIREGNIVKPLISKTIKTSKEDKTENIKEVAKVETQFDSLEIRSICQEQIDKALATISGQSEETVKTIYQQAPVQNPSTVYIPLGGGVSTTNGSWSYLGGAEGYFNKADYKNAKRVIWEVFLKIKSGNGKANARLYDATNKVVISGSEIWGEGETFSLVSSQALNLLNGNNLYQVQLRSTTGYEAYMEGARIKVEY